MRKSTIAARGLAVSLICLALAAGCGAKPEQDERSLGSLPEPTAAPNESGPAAADEAGVVPEPSNQETFVPTEMPSEPEPEAAVREVVVYGADSQMNSLTEARLSVADAGDEALLAETIKALQAGQGDDTLPLWRDIAFQRVELDGSEAKLDIAIPDTARLGAPGELLLIESLKSTLFQFSFVESIFLTVEGERVESLMGHVELAYPLVKE